jgi:hypothetical protein
MKGITLVILLLITVVIAGALTVASVYINASSTRTTSLMGVLVVYPSGSDSPQKTGTASYNVTVNAKDGVGVMNLTQIGGSDDVLPSHSYDLTNVLVSPYNITMDISGSNVSLGWITTSTIWTALNSSYASVSGIGNSTLWNDLNSSYVAASGPSAPANSTIGQFSPSVFRLSSDYYMFIGVTIPNQPTDNIPFFILPALAIRSMPEG